MNNIIAILKQLRNSRNLSQSVIAEQIGIGRSTYTKLENDPSGFTLSQLIKLAEIYNIDLALLLGIKTEHKYYDFYTQIKKLIDEVT